MTKDFKFQNLKDKKYFEGWYYKHTTNEYTFSIIPGISKNKKDPHAFIQIIENITNNSHYYKYPIEQFKYDNETFQIGNNFFKENRIIININNKIKADLKYFNITPLESTKLNPTIMGPFHYLKMQCNHSIISLNHTITGTFSIEQKNIDLTNARGYIEKDYGSSFPKNYTWIQANNKNTSLFFAIANIPLIFNFQGYIAVLLYNDKQYKFTTYNLSKINIKENTYILKKGIYTLIIEIFPKNKYKLISPKLGEMNDYIYESLNTITHITLYKKKKIIIKQTFNNTTYEKK